MPLTRAIAPGLAASLLAMTLLVGCGKRGPLYHPGERAEADPPTTQQPSEPEQQSPSDESGY